MAYPPLKEGNLTPLPISLGVGAYEREFSFCPIGCSAFAGPGLSKLLITSIYSSARLARSGR